jgi:DNA-binding response OmpR family regulator
MATGRAIEEFAGLRVLLVEDDILIAMELEEFLRDLGCEVVGPFGRLDHAIDALSRERVDGAVLDLNVRGQLTFPLIERLRRDNIPVVLCSGYADLPDIKAQLDDIPMLGKPCNNDSLKALMRARFPVGNGSVLRG